MMSFTLPHGVLCTFWWGSFPIPVLVTPSCMSQHILTIKCHMRPQCHCPLQSTISGKKI
jgi:hypothetical protein